MLRQADTIDHAAEYRREKMREDSGSFCVAHVANAMIHAAACTANLQVFCRYFAGKNQATGVQCSYAYEHCL
jgi:hypothetical protein